MNEVIYAAIYFGITLGAFLLGKYVFPKVPQDVKNKLGTLSAWAAEFVVWAREFMKSKTGEEKMAAVVEKLKEIVERLRSISPLYEDFIAAEKGAENVY